MNLNDDLVREVYDGEHHVPGEAQHLVAAVPVYDPAGHGDPRPRRDAEPAGRCPPARPAQRPPGHRSPRQHGRGSRAEPGRAEPRDRDRDKGRDKDRARAGSLPRTSALSPRSQWAPAFLAALPMVPRGVAARWRRAAAEPGKGSEAVTGGESHAALLSPTGEWGLSACRGC